jgi:hypothetical protein
VSTIGRISLIAPRIDGNIKATKKEKVKMGTAKRLCLKCGRLFASKSIGNRICPECTRQNEGNRYRQEKLVREDRSRGKVGAKNLGDV